MCLIPHEFLSHDENYFSNTKCEQEVCPLRRYRELVVVRASPVLDAPSPSAIVQYRQRILLRFAEMAFPSFSSASDLSLPPFCTLSQHTTHFMHPHQPHYLRIQHWWYQRLQLTRPSNVYNTLRLPLGSDAGDDTSFDDASHHF